MPCRHNVFKESPSCRDFRDRRYTVLWNCSGLQGIVRFAIIPMSTEPNKVIYSMVGVSKFYDKKPVLKDIYLSYFYGAKIGVIGLNGSGKSSL
jgi:ABC-type multidrug transport system fused ATPase/permease subunit